MGKGKIMVLIIQEGLSGSGHGPKCVGPNLEANILNFLGHGLGELRSLGGRRITLPSQTQRQAQPVVDAGHVRSRQQSGAAQKAVSVHGCDLGDVDDRGPVEPSHSLR